MIDIKGQGFDSPMLCEGFAVGWAAALLGFAAALPPARMRRSICAALFAVVAILFAYYGLLPSWVITLLLILALVMLMADNNLLTAWPLLLVTALIFGLIILVDPGESYTISAADENVRDRLAFRTAYMENYEDPMDDFEEFEDEEYDEGGGLFEFLSENTSFAEHPVLWILGMIGIVLLVLLGVAYLIHRRLAAKRRKIRAGIDSDDPAEAVRAMFPYAMRWLRAYGVNIENKPYSELRPAIKADMPARYSRNFDKMVDLWTEAAFSDHTIKEADRNDMKEFVADTIRMTKEESTLKDKLKIRFKYAW
jgi:hypothetical protein